MPPPRITVVVPTLTAGEPLRECLHSLELQTFPDFEIVVVDNSGRGAVADLGVSSYLQRIIENRENTGFGAAVNQAFRSSEAEFVATLNDDATASPRWLESLLEAILPRYEIGMCASKIVLSNDRGLDSAGMLLCSDGSSKQRGHREEPAKYSRNEEVFFPSGCAALYRRDMLEETGGFDESFFLYCEDTDLGLRARWGGWECRFVPEAVVEHRYSHSAGSASPLKAFYVERNRIFLIFKNFPASMLWKVPFSGSMRYFWHFINALKGRGAAGEFASQQQGVWGMLSIAMRAHWAVLTNWRSVRAKRCAIRKRLTPKQFARMAKSYRIGPRRVAEL